VKLQQIRFLCEVAANLNITAAAGKLRTAQSGISRQIRLLEREFGTAILNREGNRITGLTEEGIEIVAAARQLLGDAEQLEQMAAAFQHGSRRRLRVATTHVHARYALLPAVEAFSARYPEVRLNLVQLFDDEVRDLVESGQADVGISTRVGRPSKHLVNLPIYSLSRGLVAPKGHPLLRIKRPSIADIGRYPLILYDTRLSTGTLAHELFAEAGVEPNIVLTAMDADVLKAYVASGLGVAIIPALAFDRKTDRSLRFVNLDHVLPPTVTHLLLRRGKFLYAELSAFIHAIAPSLTKPQLQRIVAGG
jgi:DNA-binding transcriptional LysR family regulator